MLFTYEMKNAVAHINTTLEDLNVIGISGLTGFDAVILANIAPAARTEYRRSDNNDGSKMRTRTYERHWNRR